MALTPARRTGSRWNSGGYDGRAARRGQGDGAAELMAQEYRDDVPER